ncbi:hypothetical protein [Streptomyces sp. ADI96-02]|uniref:hypothetical protein n=1 Tax=Streptomyces sp. ADI96-02 TaxID=1522760 RepID=UPI000F55790A|nr:hypothetical protein [Streptomyces sp. ADI96-02]
MIILALGLAFDVTAATQRSLPDCTSGVQKKIEDSEAARQHLSGLYDDSNKEPSRCEDGVDELRSCGQAPPLEGIDSWFNTPDNEPVDHKGLRGKVSLVDFWTYSCINCQRAVPHLRDWDRASRDAGLRIVGVPSPELAFEKKRGNVISGAKKLGVTLARRPRQRPHHLGQLPQPLLACQVPRQRQRHRPLLQVRRRPVRPDREDDPGGAQASRLHRQPPRADRPHHGRPDRRPDS